MNFEIKITGSGTAQEIIDALRGVADSIMEQTRSEHETAVLDGARWEDPTLMTEIDAI